MTNKILSIVLLTGGTLMAQYGGYRSTDPYGRNGGYNNGRNGGYDNGRYDDGRYDDGRYNNGYGNNGYGNNGYGNNGYQNGQRTIDLIQRDLSNIGQRASWDRWAVKQFSDAVNNLEKFQQKASQGKFDRGRLDNAIDNLNRLLTAPELHPRDKQRIAQHRDQLRYIRSRG